MRDFDLQDVAKEVHKNHPEVDVQVIHQVLKRAFSKIIRIMNSDGEKSQFEFRKCDIMHVFVKADEAKHNAIFADLDETRMPSKAQLTAMKLERKRGKARIRLPIWRSNETAPLQDQGCDRCEIPSGESAERGNVPLSESLCSRPET